MAEINPTKPNAVQLPPRTVTMREAAAMVVGVSVSDGMGVATGGPPAGVVMYDITIPTTDGDVFKLPAARGDDPAVGLADEDTRVATQVKLYAWGLRMIAVGNYST